MDDQATKTTPPTDSGPKPLGLLLDRRHAEVVAAGMAALRLLPKLLPTAPKTHQDTVEALLGVAKENGGWAPVDKLFDQVVEYLEGPDDTVA